MKAVIQLFRDLLVIISKLPDQDRGPVVQVLVLCTWATIMAGVALYAAVHYIPA